MRCLSVAHSYLRKLDRQLAEDGMDQEAIDRRGGGLRPHDFELKGPTWQERDDSLGEWRDAEQTQRRGAGDLAVPWRGEKYAGAAAIRQSARIQLGA